MSVRTDSYIVEHNEDGSITTTEVYTTYPPDHPAADRCLDGSGYAGCCPVRSDDLRLR